MKIQINNWKKYHHRTDVKIMHWFRLSSDVPNDPKMYGLTASDKWLFICLLSFCAKHNGDTIVMECPYIEHITGVADIDNRLKLLEKHGLVTLMDRICPTTVPDLSHGRASTGQDIREEKRREENRTEENKRSKPSDSQANADKNPSGKKSHWLIEVWNQNRGKLPEARKSISESRRKKILARIKQEPDRKDWEEVIQRLSASDFCNGKNDNGWVADFGFLIKPETFTATLEGRYDNRQGARRKTREETVSQANAELFNELGGENGNQ